MPAPLVPDHELLRLIGRGSYGEVWLARNVMGAWRAVKGVRRDTFDSERPFEREFSGIQRYEPISRSVEGVVPILQVGRIPEGFYYVMELADDASGIAPGNSALAVDTYAPRTLRSDLKRLGRLPVAECLELGLALAAGLAHLHRHGLVHRDLKPSNLIFVNGRARLADLGLVGAIDEVRSFVGTPGYIPPEGPGSPAADVFGLGRVLYEAVTGLSPEDFPNPPADWLTGEISHGALELHEVILRACEPDPLRRHRSASELQADLTLLQSGQSVRRARTLERRVKTLRRVGQAAGLAVLLLAGLGLFAVARARSEREAAVRAESLRKRAEQAEKSARLELSNAQLAQAGLLRRSGLVGQRTRALELIGRAAQTSDRLADLRTEAIAARALPDFTEIKKTRLLAGPPGFWCAVDQTLSRYTRAHPDGSVRIHSWDDDREMATLEGAMAAGLAVWPFSASGALAGGRGGDQAYVWDTRTGKRIFSRTIPGLVGLSITPDDTAVALRVRDGDLILVRLADGAEDTRIAPGFSDGGFALSPDGRSFAFFSPSRCEAVLFDKTGKLRDTVRLPPPACPIGLLWAPDSQGLLLAGDDFRSYYAKIDQPEFRAVRLEGHQAEIVGGAAHADQGHALTTSWDETTRLWSLATGRQLLRMNGRGLEFRWAAERLGWLEAGEPGTFRLREFEAFMPSGVRVLPGQTPPRALASNKGAWDVAFVAEGQALAVASYDGVRFWPIGGGAPRLLALGWSRWIEPDPSGTALWVSTATQILRVPLHWDAVKRELWIGEPAPAGLRGRELPLALTGAGSTLLSASGTELLRAASNVVESLGEMPDFTTRLRASPDGRWLLAGDRFSTEMHLLSATNGSSIRQLRVSQNSYGVFLAGSEDLLLITPDGVRRERREDGEVRWVVPRMGVGGGGPVAVAPDGRTLALAPGGREAATPPCCGTWQRCARACAN